MVPQDFDMRAVTSDRSCCSFFVTSLLQQASGQTFMLAEIFLIGLIYFLWHMVKILLRHFFVAVSEVIPHTLYGNSRVKKLVATVCR